MKASWVVLAAAAGADAQLFWGSSGGALHERRTKDTQPVLNVGALNGTLQQMISDVSGLRTGLQSAATSVASLEARVLPPPPAVPAGMAAFHAIDADQTAQANAHADAQADDQADSQADAQAEAEASARAEAVARAEEAEEAKETDDADEADAPAPRRRPRLSQAVSAKSGRADSHAQGKAEEEEEKDEESEGDQDADQAADEAEEDQDTAPPPPHEDDWDRGWSEEAGQEAPQEDEAEDVVVMQHHKRHGSAEVRDEAPDAVTVREAASMAVVHQHGSHGQRSGKKLRRSQSLDDEAESEDEDDESNEEAEEEGNEDDESGEWAWGDEDKTNAFLQTRSRRSGRKTAPAADEKREYYAPWFGAPGTPQDLEKPVEMEEHERGYSGNTGFPFPGAAVADMYQEHADKESEKKA